MTLGSFVKPFPTITKGELEPQFASKDSYFEQNIKKVCRSNCEVTKHTWELYLIYIIIHVPSYKMWKHLGQFGGLVIKTSQEPKLWKNWKIRHFNKNPKRRHYSGIRAWYWNLMWSYIYDEWSVIYDYYRFHVHPSSVWGHFTQFSCIWRRFGAISPRVELVRTIVIRL